MTQASKRIQQEAHSWAAKGQLGSLTPKEESELQAWLARDERHKGAYIRAQTVRAHVERIAALAAGVTPAAAQPRRRLLRFISWVAARSRRRVGFYAAAATLTLATLGTLYLAMEIFRGESFASDLGELRQVALNDGSSMVLSSATKVTVDLRAASRDVRVTQGEALFDVAKDPGRPFLVHAGDVTVKAVGTAFSIRKDDDRIDVTVSEGTVELFREAGSPPTRLSANHRATIEASAPLRIQSIERRETDRQLAWRTGRLEFDGQPLAEAVAEINRHNRRKVVVTDPELARHPIVGSFRAIDAEAFANIAAATLNARVVDEGDIIRIERQ